jgi:hypothetical protein
MNKVQLRIEQALVVLGIVAICWLYYVLWNL